MLDSENCLVDSECGKNNVSPNFLIANMFGQNAINRLSGSSQFHLNERHDYFGWVLRKTRILLMLSRVIRNLAWPTWTSSLMSLRTFLKQGYNSWTLPPDGKSLLQTCYINWNVSVSVLASLKQNQIFVFCSMLNFVQTMQTYCQAGRNNSASS